MREVEIWRSTLPTRDTQSSRMDERDAPAVRTCSVRAHATPEGLAQWMADRLQENGRLYQRRAAREIAERFGEFTYVNDNGNLAIDKRILKAFREVPGGPPV
jgi:hypothetical protein